MRLSRHHRQWIYAVGGGLVGSGVGWLIAHYLLVGASAFGETHHPSEPWWLRLHGASMIGFLVVFGALLPGHVARGWRRRRNRRSGIFMVATTVVLGLSGYGLYYLGDEATRPWISAVHWVIGLAAGAGLVLHVTFGKRGMRRT